MSSVTAYPASMTVEEFEAFPFPDGKVELVRGEPRVNPPAGEPHGYVQSNLMMLLVPFIMERELGRFFMDGLGYELLMLPRTVRNPDMSFVRAERLRSRAQSGFVRIPPDLAIEVLSPSDKGWELKEKLDDYRAAAIPLVWIIDPKRRMVRILTLGAAERTIGPDDELDGGAALPGFACRVTALFEGL